MLAPPYFPRPPERASPPGSSPWFLVVLASSPRLGGWWTSVVFAGIHLPAPPPLALEVRDSFPPPRPLFVPSCSPAAVIASFPLSHLHPSCFLVPLGGKMLGTRKILIGGSGCSLIRVSSTLPGRVDSPACPVSILFFKLIRPVHVRRDPSRNPNSKQIFWALVREKLEFLGLY